MKYLDEIGFTIADYEEHKDNGLADIDIATDLEIQVKTLERWKEAKGYKEGSQPIAEEITKLGPSPGGKLKKFAINIMSLE